MDAHYTNGIAYGADHRQSQPYRQNQQLQQLSRTTHQSLPPLQPHDTTLPYHNDLFNPSSQAPQPSYQSNISPLSEYASYSQLRYPISQPNYPSSFQQYSNASNFISQPSQALTFDPSHVSISSEGRLPDLRPMPVGGLTQSSSSSTSYGPSPSYTTPALTPEQGDSPRTHVVGSQGRRGILPNAPGRPTAVQNDGTAASKMTVMPIKDADGKFPCPHCNKTYLHAKHLKRHLLRHTGDRPYSCILCNDTFSRSDILKRHFQKCSLRRGNPTGATHLSNSQSYLKKHGAKKPSISNADSIDFSSVSQNPIPSERSLLRNGSATGLGIHGVTDEPQSASTPASRSNSIKRRDDGATVRSKRSMTGPVPSTSDRAMYSYSSEEAGISSLPASTISTPYDMRQGRHSGQFPQVISPEQTESRLNPYLLEQTSSTISRHKTSRPQTSKSSFLDGNTLPWSPLHTDTRIYNNRMSSSSGQEYLQVKSEPEESKYNFATTSDLQSDHLLGSFFSNPSTGPINHDVFQNWSLQDSPSCTCNSKVEQLIDFCESNSTTLPISRNPDRETLRRCLTADNVEHFLALYSNFQGHWPVIHMPTFDPLEAYDGLVLAMVCIGAVYSDRIGVTQVRALMETVKSAIRRSSHVYRFSEASGFEIRQVDLEHSSTLEELQAIILLATISMWHGDPTQRQAARQDFIKDARCARLFQLLQPAPAGSPSYSTLHQPSPICERANLENWSWPAWIHQEARSHVMYSFYLVDAALVMFFNHQPQFDPMEIRLPLPADDAAWEASSAAECAAALGLHGPDAQATLNVSGSLRSSQPEMYIAMQALLHPNYEFEARTTNIFSKFILIHGLHVQIWQVQRQLSQGVTPGGLNELGYLTSSPIPYSEGIFRGGGSANTSCSNSGQATPTDSSGAQSPVTHQLLRATTTALSKWKKMWDEDMPIQYPRGSTRLGFCRDGYHFYWLALLFLRSNRASDWHAPADSRFLQVMGLLKRVRTWVATESAKRGEEIGANSAVNGIDENYGVEDLTLDMKQLFTPLEPEFHPRTGSIHPGTGLKLI